MDENPYASPESEIAAPSAAETPPVDTLAKKLTRAAGLWLFGFLLAMCISPLIEDVDWLESLDTCVVVGLVCAISEILATPRGLRITWRVGVTVVLLIGTLIATKLLSVALGIDQQSYDDPWRHARFGIWATSSLCLLWVTRRFLMRISYYEPGAEE